MWVNASCCKTIKMSTWKGESLGLIDSYRGIINGRTRNLQMFHSEWYSPELFLSHGHYMAF